MRRTILGVAVLLGAMAAAGEVRAEEPVAGPTAKEPSSGLLLLLGGAGLTAAGAIDIGTAPLCTLHAIRSTAQPACIGSSIGFGVALLAGGIPLLVLGTKQRAVWSEWTKRATVEPAKSGATVTARWAF